MVDLDFDDRHCQGCHITEWEAISLFLNKEDSANDFLAAHGILPPTDVVVKCDDCPRLIHYDPQIEGWKCETGPRWYIDPKRGRRKRILKRCRMNSTPIWRRTGTVLSGSKLPAWKWLLMANLFCRKEFSHRKLRENLGVCNSTAQRHKRKIHKACNLWQVTQMDPIGGTYPTRAPKIVEVDETLVVKHKKVNGREREYQALWLVGGVERYTDKCFVVPLADFTTSKSGKEKVKVAERNKENLVEIVEKHVKRGSTVMTDGWRSYQRLDKRGYNHRRVIHEKWFVTPNKPYIHTQKVERFWGDLKEWIKRRGMVPKHLESYVSRYMWIRNLRKSPGTELHQLMKLLAGVYKHRYVT